MAHDVFISYSHEDQTTANGMVATLESHGIRCWIDYRDALPGMDYEEAIIDAIDEAKALVLIFSSHSNASVHIKREVERAVSLGLSVLNFRTEDIAPSKTLEYLISTPHWLDAMNPPLEDHLTRLADTLTVLLAKKGKKIRHKKGGKRDGGGGGGGEGGGGGFSRRILLFSLIASLAGVVLAIVIWWHFFPKPNPQITSTQKFFSSTESTLPPENERVYKDRFQVPASKCIIWCEVNLTYPKTPAPVSEPIESTWYGPKGNVLDNSTTKHTFKAGSDNAQIILKGIDIKNKEPGTYHVVTKIGGQEVVTPFQLVEAGVKRETLPANVLFEDKFTTLDPSWGAPGANISAKDGKLIITVDKDMSEIHLNQAFLPNDMEASYSVTFFKAGDPTYGSGLVFWAKNYDDYYAFLTKPLGQFSVLHYISGRELWPIAWRPDDNLKKGEGAENQFKLVAKGNQFTIFINGIEILSFPGHPPAGGSHIGFEVDSGPQGQNSVAFSNFRVVQP
ncbi:MAG: TIR domain-containing protein [Desulfobaccales bacterium]